MGQFQAGLPAGEGVYETKSGDIFVGRLLVWQLIILLIDRSDNDENYAG